MLNISKTKEVILNALTTKKTQTELAKELNLSFPAINKEIKELIYLDFIKELEKKPGKTRPYKVYIRNDFFYFISSMQNNFYSDKMCVNEYLKLHLNLWKIPQKEYLFFIESFLWAILCDSSKIKELDSFAIFGSVAKGNATENSDIDILLISQKNSKILDYGKEGAIITDINGDKKMIMAQTFTKEEFLNNYKKGSKFIKEILSNMIIIYDKENFLYNLKNGISKK